MDQEIENARMTHEKEKMEFFVKWHEKGFTVNQLGGSESQAVVKEVKFPEWVKDQTFESWKDDYEAYRKQMIGRLDEETIVCQQKKERVRLKLLEMLKKIEDEKIKEFVKSSIINNESVKTTLEGIMSKLEDRFGAS